MSQLFAWGGQSIGVSASALVLPMNTQDWSPLGWTSWISLQSKGLSSIFSNTNEVYIIWNTFMKNIYVINWCVLLNIDMLTIRFPNPCNPSWKVISQFIINSEWNKFYSLLIQYKYSFLKISYHLFFIIFIYILHSHMFVLLLLLSICLNILRYLTWQPTLVFLPGKFHGR